MVRLRVYEHESYGMYNMLLAQLEAREAARKEAQESKDKTEVEE